MGCFSVMAVVMSMSVRQDAHAQGNAISVTHVVQPLPSVSRLGRGGRKTALAQTIFDNNPDNILGRT
jgi:hypothetical protein